MTLTLRAGESSFHPGVPPLKGLGFIMAAYPALKGGAIIFRLASRDSVVVGANVPAFYCTLASTA